MLHLQDITVSAIIPSLGRYEVLNAIASVLNQTVPVLEVIVVLDSSDPPPDFLQELDSRVKVVWHGRLGSANAARQAGAKVARGDLLALLDDDDVWLPLKLERQLRAVMPRLRRQDLRWISATASVVESGTKSAVWPRRPLKAGEPVVRYLFYGWRSHSPFLQPSTWLLPTELAQEVNFDSTVGLHDDYEYLITAQVSHQIDVLFLNDPLSTYALRAGKLDGASERWIGSVEWALKESLPLSKKDRGTIIAREAVRDASRQGGLIEALKAAWTATRVAFPHPSVPVRAFARLMALALLTRRRGH